ncbi:hypothetical protein V6N11_012496 [Hibiscus sabdariffa]|uniref:Secreted protein n=1 Tax=Hibiscus sabdariffa TaxID=183260 RepID=A0ABR2QBE4_9ROSI
MSGLLVAASQLLAWPLQCQAFGRQIWHQIDACTRITQGFSGVVILDGACLKFPNSSFSRYHVLEEFGIIWHLILCGNGGGGLVSSSVVFLGCLG